MKFRFKLNFYWVIAKKCNSNPCKQDLYYLFKWSLNPCKQEFQKVLQREFKLLHLISHEKKRMKMGSFIKFDYFIDPLKWPDMAQNQAFFLMTSYTIQEFLHVRTTLKIWALKITIWEWYSLLRFDI